MITLKNRHAIYRILFKTQLTSFIKRNNFLLLSVIFLVYSAIQIFRSSFVINRTRYFSLFDDEMISMRYAYNLAHGHGLVWNVGGEHVEGFTNFLWTIYMAMIHLLPIPISKTSLFVQITGVACMILTLYFVRQIAALISKRSFFVMFLSVLFTAFYFPLINWNIILGTEVSILTLLLAWCSLLALRSIQTNTFSSLLFVLLGIGVLVRIDFLAMAVTIILCLLLFDSGNRKNYLLVGIPILLSILGLLLVFRLQYYHDLLPNTYYLKMTGYPLLRRILTGAYVGLKSMNWTLILIPFIYAYFARNKSIYLLLSLFTLVSLYSVYVGGDAWEQLGGANRYVAIAMPEFFICFILAIHAFRSLVRKQFPIHFVRYFVVELLVLSFCFLIFNTGSDNTPLVLFLLKSPQTVGENENQVRMAQSLTKFTLSDAKIGIVWAGITPYFSQRTYVDLLGKNERVIAHEQAHYDTDTGSLQQLISFKPGHNKWDYHYVVARYRPDVFGQIFPETANTFLRRDYIEVKSREGYEYYVLRGSKKVKYLSVGVLR